MTKCSNLLWRVLIKTLLFIGITALVQVLWVTLEVAVYGAPQPRAVDTIVGLALSAALYRNLRHGTKIGGT